MARLLALLALWWAAPCLAQFEPMLFMSPRDDTRAPYGVLRPVSSTVMRAEGLLPPPLGSLVAAFPVWGGGGGFEVWSAVNNTVLVTATDDFKAWGTPLAVALAPSLGALKSCDRNETDGTVVCLTYASDSIGVVAFRCPAPLTVGCCKPVAGGGGWFKGQFFDHDDANIIYDAQRSRWVDLQIFLIPAPALNRTKPYCDNAAGNFTRVLTVHTSSTGTSWTPAAACLGEQKSQYCPGPYNTSKAAVLAPGADDPPELQFYRVRPFFIGGGSSRLAAHALLYAPSPIDVPASARCLGGAGFPGACCHGPHLDDELWLGPPSGDPAELANWTRPFGSGPPFAPLGVFLMPQPLFLPQVGHIFLDAASGSPGAAVWMLPQHRLAGLRAFGNAAFTTAAFPLPASGLAVNADVNWPQAAGAPGDEERGGYIMAELIDESTGAPFPGLPRASSIIVNATGLAMPLRWTGTMPPPGTSVAIRFYLRAATIYAVTAL